MATLYDPQRTTFAAMSKRNFYLREHIIKFCLQRGYTPLCAFMMFSYYLLDTVERNSLIRANNELIRRSDELWVFGSVSDGVQAEIDFAKQLRLPIAYYRVIKDFNTFERVSASEAVWE